MPADAHATRCNMTKAPGSSKSGELAHDHSTHQTTCRRKGHRTQSRHCLQSQTLMLKSSTAQQCVPKFSVNALPPQHGPASAQHHASTKCSTTPTTSIRPGTEPTAFSPEGSGPTLVLGPLLVHIGGQHTVVVEVVEVVALLAGDQDGVEPLDHAAPDVARDDHAHLHAQLC